MRVSRALTVVWVDPGQWCGWSVHRVSISELVERGQVASMSRTWWKIGQYRAPDTSSAVDSFLGLARVAYERSSEEDVVVLGCEGFTLMMRSTDPALLEPVRFLAVLRDRLRGSGMGVQTQGASEAMNTITDARLRLWGVYQSNGGHARDAQRHGLLFLRRFASDQSLRERLIVEV